MNIKYVSRHLESLLFFKKKDKRPIKFCHCIEFALFEKELNTASQKSGQKSMADCINPLIRMSNNDFLGYPTKMSLFKIVCWDDEAKMASELLVDCPFLSVNCKNIECDVSPHKGVLGIVRRRPLPSSNREFYQLPITTSLTLKCHLKRTEL